MSTSGEVPDLFFTDAYRRINLASVLALHSVNFNGLCSAFKANIHRVHVMCVIPMAAINVASRHLLMLSQATFDEIGKPVMDDGEYFDHHESIWKRYDIISAETFFDTRPLMLSELQSEVVQHNKREIINSPHFRPGYEALLASQVIGCWSAFETLATDLWVQLVNIRPKLAVRCLKGKQFPLEALQKHGFNWEFHVGELVKDKAGLGTFDGIKKAFAELLPQVPEITNALNADSLGAVRSVRNCLVHRSGIADSCFLNETKSVPPWRDVKVREQLPLDGANVAELVNAVIEVGCCLVKSVDQWLAGDKSRDGGAESRDVSTL